MKLVACTPHHCLLAVALLALLCGCVRHAPESRAPVDTPPLDTTAHDREIDAAARGIAAREAERVRHLVALRGQLDVLGASAHCAQLVAQVEDHDPRQAWLDAWCAWRKRDWQRVRAALPRAITFHELAAQPRRVIELHLMGAIAAHHTQDGEARAHHSAQAQRWWRLSREPLPAHPLDPLGADLSYLLACARHLGIDLHAHDEAPALDPLRLFELSLHEHQRHQAVALPHVWRAQAAWALDAGELGLAARSLHVALSADRRAVRHADVAQDTALFIALSDLLGHKALSDEAIEWLEVQPHGELFADELLTPTLPASHHELITASADRASRRRALLALRSLRNHAPRRAQPPRELLQMLATLPDPMPLAPGSFELAAELGGLLAERGEDQLARRYLDFAVAELERVRRSLPSLHERQSFLSAWRHIYIALLHQQIGVDTDRLTQRDYGGALRLVSLIKARGLGDLLDGLTLPVAPARRVASSRDALPERMALTLTSWGEGGPEHTATLVESGGAPHFNLALPAPSVALELVLSERVGYAIVAQSDGTLTMRRIAGRRELEPLLVEFRQTLATHDYSRADYARHRDLSERLYVALIAPVQDLIVDAEHLYIAPDGALHDIPFEALARPSLHAQPDYLLRHHALSYAPSLKILAQLRARSQSSAASRVAASSGMPRALVLGAPRLEQSALDLLSFATDVPRDGMLDMEELFPSLPGSARELAQVERAMRRLGFERDVLSGERATERAVSGQAALMPYQLIHVASHGLSDAEGWRGERAALLGVSEPALLLARDPSGPEDGVWRLEEVLRQTTRARLIVLSGCTTGRGWRALGDGAYGLAGAFLATGSDAVIGSSWSVSDEATMALMSRFYGRLGADLDASRALRRAALELLDAPHAGGPYLPPFYWAGFRVLGG